MALSQRINAAFETGNLAFERKSIWVIAIIALAVFQTFLIVSHEPWADELQAALIATEAPDLATMFAWLRYEGHPPLWYLLLRFLGQLVPPDTVLWVAALLIAVFSQSVILFVSPFSRLERLLLASSQYVLFEFLTISRGTTLGVGLLLGAMVLWRTRWFWLIMALLPLVDFLFEVISGVFLIMKWREKELWWPGVGVWLAGSAIAAWSIIPPEDMVSAFAAMSTLSGTDLMLDTLRAWRLKMGSLPFPFQGGISPQWNTPVIPIAGVAWIVMLMLCWILTKGAAWHRMLIFGFFGFTLALSLAVYPIGLRHMMLGAFLLILLFWRQIESGDTKEPFKKATLQIWFVLLALSGITSSTISTVHGFDSAPNVVAEIERRDLTDKHWIMLPEWRAPAIAAQSNIVFGRPGEQCSFSFVRWDHQYSAIRSRAAFTEMLEKEIALHGRSYLLTDHEFENFPEHLIKEIAYIPAGYSGIEYWIHVVGPDAKERPVSLPPCHSINSRPKLIIP